MNNTVVLIMPEHFLQSVSPLLSLYLPEFKIETISSDVELDAISDILYHADFLLFTGTTISHALISKAHNLKLIQKWGSGIDGIDLLAAERLGVPVANVPGGNATAVAEHFFGLLLGLYKRICWADASVRARKWPQPELISQGITELSGKTLGIVGLGRIGRAVACRALAFDLKCIYYKRNRLDTKEEQEIGVSYAPLDALVQQADIIGLTLPLTNETRALFNYQLFLQMRSSSILINVSRGSIVNEADLYRALNEGKIAGAGLDVLESEPPSRDNPLLQLQNVIVTPHIAGRTREAITRITQQCANNILLVSGGDQPQHLV